MKPSQKLPNDAWEYFMPKMTLTMNLQNQDQKTFRMLIIADNQNSFVEIDVDVKREFGENLFDVIRARSPHLKKLHLTTRKFADVKGRETMKVDWIFL